jgi:aminobenzoyl-glutamate utilization protein B
VLKKDVAIEIDGMKDLTQQMVDSLFSFGELGFQEVETARYCTEILRKNGFSVQEHVAGMPTGWVATWGSGKPVLAVGSDVDGLAGTSQKPGIPERAPYIENGPGHGEGHNTGIPLSITAALAVRKIMEREKLTGTLKVWPGIAEELLGGKAQFVRAGVFKDVDIVLFSHVSSNFGVSWGAGGGTGAVSVEYTFLGQSAHAGSAPWQGRSALDAVELMDVGWNFRREHLRLSERSHYVITDGGGQPNVVPPKASVWYYFREIDYPHIKELRDLGNTIAQAAAMMTDTSVTSRVLGSAWPQHMNKVVAETVFLNIQKVGLPQWSDADQALAKATQKLVKVPERGLASEIGKLGEPVIAQDNRGGGSDDIGDVSWTVPTVTLRYPANIPNLPGTTGQAPSRARPIAHKERLPEQGRGDVLDLLLKRTGAEGGDYFRNGVEGLTTPLIGESDKPAIWLNEQVMQQVRPELRKYYYDPAKYQTYLEQLGISYPPAVK